MEDHGHHLTSPAPPRRSLCFRPERRLRKSRDFRFIERRGARVQVGLLTVIVRRARPGQGRVGFTVSKKVGGAVVRNRVKRRLREIVRHRLHLLADCDLIVIAREACANATFDALSRDFDLAGVKAQEVLNRSASKPRSS